jgi:outer membrane protein assembly factor BamB
MADSVYAQPPAVPKPPAVAAPKGKAGPPEAAPPTAQKAPAVAGDKQNVPEGKQKSALPNPLTDWLRRQLMRRADPARPLRPPGMGPNPAGKQAKASRDQTDPRIPFDAQKTSLLRKARGAIQAREWKSAVDLLQKLIEQPEDSMMRVSGGQIVSLHAEAQRLLGGLPPEVLENYRLQYGGLSRQQLAAAVQSGSARALADVALRYFPTDAGYEAVNLLGTLHFDRGEFGLAAREFSKLLAAGAPLCQQPAWKLKAAFAARQIDDSDLEAKLLTELAGLGANPGVSAGGEKVQPDAWLAAHPRSALPAAEPLREWPLFYGNSSRTGIAAGGEPLLLQKWSQPTTSNAPIHTQLSDLMHDLDDQGLAPLPASFPLMVAGKVVFRTLRGVRVVDALSGQLQWETPDEFSAERLLAHLPPDDEATSAQAFLMGFGRQMMFSQNSGGVADQQPLCHLLFRNANYGIVSSDGERLFIVEDQPVLSSRQPGQFWNEETPDTDQFGRSLSSNKLSAYDLQTGRSAWEVGGAQLSDAFELPLAGQFFLGTPVVDGGELFVVGEKENDIRLFALDARTGDLKWSQLLAHSTAKIEADVVRQWCTSQVAVAEGVLICPTTVGWLMAVDRRTHLLLWAYPYSAERTRPAGPADPSEDLMDVKSLNECWAPAPPLVIGDRVLYTPAEESHLVCLNLYSGKRLWQKPRGELLYLAGAFEDRAVLVGSSAVVAVSLHNGTESWSTPLNPEQGRPSGRGVVVGKSFYLPLTSGELWNIDLQTGKLGEKSYLPEKLTEAGGGLGNLAMYRGMLISLNPLGLTAFEQRESIESEIRARLARNPRDAWANLRQAEFEALKRNAAAALQALHQIQPEELAAEFQPRYRELLIDSLTHQIRADFAASDPAFDELARVMETPREKLAAQRLWAERHVTRKEYQAAFEAYLALAREPGDEFVAVGSVQTRPDLWLAGQLRDLWRELPEAARSELDGRVAALAAEAANQAPSEQIRFLTLFGSHPAALPIKQKWAADQAAAREFLATENTLSELQRQPTTAAAATWQLARLMEQFSLPADADHFYRQLERDFPEVVLDGQTGAARAQAWRGQAGAAASPPSLSAPWKNADVTALRTGAPYVPSVGQELSLSGAGLPFFREHRLDFLPQEQRFEVVRAATEARVWSQPLRSRGNAQDAAHVSARVTGHQVVVLHRGVVHCLSPVERRVLWTYTFDERLGQALYSNPSHRQPLQPLQPAKQPGLLDQIAGDLAVGGALCVANSEYVCLQGRRKFVVLDARTGALRWMREGAQAETLLQGNEEVLYQISPDQRRAVAFRVLDGKELPAPDLFAHFRKAAQLVGKDLLLTEAEQTKTLFGFGTKKLKLRLFDPLSAQTVWQLELPGETVMTALSREQLALLEPGGKFQLLEMRTGKLSLLTTIPTAEWKSKSDTYAFADYDNIYLAVNRSQSGASFYADGLLSLRLNGTLRAFDPQTRTERWSQKVAAQNLIYDRLDHCPILVCASRNLLRRDGLNTWAFGIVALEKQTGRKLLESTFPTQTGFQSFAVNVLENYVELRSYQERLRLILRPATAANP